MFQKLKEVFPDTKIDFSKFASLRPKKCVLAGASGTHSVCACTIHHKHEINDSRCQAGFLTSEWNHPITGCQECIARIVCIPITPACFLGSCPACAFLEELKEELVQVFANHMIDNVQYLQWTSTDRSNLETT